MAGIGLAATRPGAVLALASITVADDATAGAGLPFPFDCEGTPKQRVELIAAGQITADTKRAALATSGPRPVITYSRRGAGKAVSK